jgi:hypothetical protein
MGFFTNCVEIALAKELLDLKIIFARGRADFEPLRLFERSDLACLRRRQGTLLVVTIFE